MLVPSGTLLIPCYFIQLKTNPVYFPHPFVFSVSSLLNNATLSWNMCFYLPLVGWFSTINSFGFSVQHLILMYILLAGMVREGQLNGSSAAHSDIRGILFPVLLFVNLSAENMFLGLS